MTGVKERERERKREGEREKGGERERKREGEKERGRERERERERERDRKSSSNCPVSSGLDQSISCFVYTWPPLLAACQGAFVPLPVPSIDA